MTQFAYKPVKPSRSQFVELRGLRHHIRCWGDEGAPTLFFFHGGRDASATFQFVVDALKDNWRILALDWRGHGQSARPSGGYWYHDYVADLEAFLDMQSPDEPVTIVGHSLGANVSHIYAGARPHRVRRLVSLDGFGLAEGDPETAPDRVRRWLDSLNDVPVLRTYASFEDMAVRLRQANPRLAADKALFLAETVSTRNSDGTLDWAFDPRHRAPFPSIYRFAEWAACFKRIEAPVLWLSAELGRSRSIDIAEVERRCALIPQSARIHIEGVGHNLHHEAPAIVAKKIEPFLLSGLLPLGETVRHGAASVAAG